MINKTGRVQTLIPLAKRRISLAKTKMDNKRAQVKCKLITGTYILQGNRATFNQHDVNPTCELCHTAPETRQHFLSECTSFLTKRQEFITKIQINLNEKMNDFLNTPENLTQLLLDASALLNTGSVQTDVLDLLELYTREYIYKIHKKRFAKLKQISHRGVKSPNKLLALHLPNFL